MKDEKFKDLVESEVKAQATLRTNATSMGAGLGYGAFPLYSRVNHSCTPNVHANYNPSSGTHTVHAIRDIKAGEEILTSYINSAQSCLQRTRALEEFGVDCYCSTCFGPTAKASERSRTRLEKINSDLKTYDSGKHNPRVTFDLVPNHPKDALTVAEEAIKLLKEEGLFGLVLTKAYRQASKYALALGFVENAKSYAVKELEVERNCLGTETGYMKEPCNAESWKKQVEIAAERDKVKFKMCEKRGAKEQKKANQKAAKKAKKR